MQENYDFVQRGFRLLLPAMSGYIGQKLNQAFQEDWWREVLYTLNDPPELPQGGDYGTLLDSLDIANCIRLLDRKWGDVFRTLLPRHCRSWANELMGIRNIAAHIGNQDLDQSLAERALDTMDRLCQEIDPDSADELHALYLDIRSRADDQPDHSTPFTGLPQPVSASNRGASASNSLLQLVGTDAVQKTTLTRKVPFGGKTVIYPVYKVRLDQLFYNDQNDRISTWITRYESENGQDSLHDLSTDVYNRVIEDFVFESNPESIQKTQRNISMVGQREPGVTLADGRIVDGNRRYTCLRRLQRDSKVPQYFETVLMDMDISADRKQIKLLELTIQHGEEKKVDYDQIDYAMGTYRDIVQTKLLTVEEYAAGTNEPQSEVKKRLEIAALICEFLRYIKLPDQYHAAREYQVYSIFQEMMPSLHQLNEQEQEQLKTIAFHNAVMKAITDQRKFIRDIKGLVKSQTYLPYFEEQATIGQRIRAIIDAAPIHSKVDLDCIAEAHPALTTELQMSMERALQRTRSQKLKAKPQENVSKAASLMLEIDPRLFDKLDPDERSTLKAGLLELKELADRFAKLL